ncbi:MAG: heme exporter protein CcmD [Gammaproteobacteria bacterium]|jgi:heme exporter protein D|nr:heme exporter protein CcmD [Gammaproteobacteria bacterium]MBU2179172.1 heme exporter protein CcmD [Gammaproteobacteria bacterium]MBU2222851.1 heme exporter protein CcmD [Gammaproteobacteria bacterium]MBU2278842.1 heme exporter protein CcmD [Gammaproteobacteria bacterium]MBU2429020.1 heme exporter protein CcmD [Gammaproteobacteria bacterium]
MPELYFSSWTAFFEMGGYALFVWLSFGVTFALLGLLWWHSQLGHRQMLRQLAAKQAREFRVQQQLQQEQS